jgi:soluble lytic murein transglycosylase-like protein
MTPSVRARLAGWIVVGVAVAFPASLRDGAQGAPRVEPDPAVAALVSRVQALLGTRMPQVGADHRASLARTIVAEAGTARIDPVLVLAVIQVESSFQPAAVSPRGAMGLMQLREPTMRREVERAGLVLENPHDPILNVQAGVRYLRRLLDAFGREELALIAYNAGPNRLLGFIREGEIPDRFHAYPRRVRAEQRRLVRAFGQDERVAMAAPALASPR